MVFRNSLTPKVGISCDDLNHPIFFQSVILFPSASAVTVTMVRTAIPPQGGSCPALPQSSLRAALGLLHILWGTIELCLRQVYRPFLYTPAPFCFIPRLFLQFHHELDISRHQTIFFQKIIGDILTIRLYTGNTVIIILLSLYRFLLYHLPCSLYFSVGNWFCEGVLYHPHWLCGLSICITLGKRIYYC